MKRGSRWLAVLLLVVLGVPPLALGAGPPSEAKGWQRNPYAIRDPKVDPRLSPAARARAQRMADIKRKADLKKVSEQQTASSAAAGQSGKGGAK